jgi:uncharacterized protein YbjT (DUF2867 family)
MPQRRSQSSTTPRYKRILLTGATGYVGGRLLGVLHHHGYSVRALARRPGFLHTDPSWRVVKVQGDVLDTSSLVRAMKRIDAAFYLVHSMGSPDDFVELDREGARNFGEAARTCGVKRIIYLGGLGSGAALSPHLKSRQEVGDILRASGVQVIELRASIVIGSGSLSFEMIRALVERLPVMITPRWVSVKAQPVAITDLLEYLVKSLAIPGDEHHTIEIGGADRVSYGELMREYARQRGLRRVMLPVPVLSPRLSSLWLGLVTPLYARTGRKLVESLRHPTTVENRSAERLFGLRPFGVREAIAAALKNEEREYAETRWSDAVSSLGPSRETGTTRIGNRLVNMYTSAVQANPAASFQPIQRVGGETGWYSANWLWRIRGLLDLIAGGPGMRRGRRHTVDIHVGDVIDWWRVEAFEPGRLLRLHAEMKLPGRAWLEFTVEPDGETSIIRQTAVFDPHGLPGLIYWYGTYPLHVLVFKGMLKGIVRETQRAGASFGL